MRPKTSSARGAKVCAPNDTRLMPASRYPENRPRSMVPGLASMVTSTSSANAIRCRNAPISRPKSSGWNKLGVPPPKNTVSILRPVNRGSSRSKSRISASMQREYALPTGILGLEQTGRAAAEEYRVDPAARQPRQFQVEIANQRIDVRGVGRGRLQLLRIEIAV